MPMWVKDFTHLDELDIAEDLGVFGGKWHVEPLFPSGGFSIGFLLLLDDRYLVGDR